LILQFDVALSAGSIVDPKGSSAWDIYQRLASDPSNAAEAARLKPLLAAAMLKTGRALVTSDVRTDNVADKIEDFKRAGQILSRARSLGASGDIAVLEKLSAAEALVGLQFYDEAELALNQLQNAKSAAVENALGLVYHGKLEALRAERAFKRAIELEPGFAAAHYNLAMVYRAAQNEAAVAELEQAAELDPANASLLAALGDELFSRQKWQQAAAAFRKALSVKPADDALHTKLGHALFSQGLTEEANIEYRKASELRRKQ
jgi:tetratricopeptide (TPR) repeat protein